MAAEVSARAIDRVRPLTALAAAAAYGFALGASHDLLYAGRNLVKFPLLIVATAAIASLAYWIAALTLRARVSFAAAQRIAWGLFQDAALLLASLAPAVLFVGTVLHATDDGVLGEYDFFLAANVGLIAVAGTIALVRRSQVLLPLAGRSPRHARLIAVAWLALSLFVGGQVTFLLRPLVGMPATRGARPPWFLGTSPDARGATSFYGLVWQALAHAPLHAPPGYGR